LFNRKIARIPSIWRRKKAKISFLFVSKSKESKSNPIERRKIQSCQVFKKSITKKKTKDVHFLWSPFLGVAKIPRYLQIREYPKKKRQILFGRFFSNLNYSSDNKKTNREN